MFLPIKKIEQMEQIIKDAKKRIKEECGISVSLLINGVEEAKLIGAEGIVQIVCKTLNVNMLAVISRDRHQPVVYARYICIAFIKEFVGIKRPEEIADYLNRDRTTINHALVEIQKLVETKEETFCRMYRKALAAITEEAKNIAYETE